MDDWFAHKNALRDIIDNFEGNWLITGVDNNLSPYWTDDIHLGVNKLGSPSALTILNKNPLMFDEKLGWLLDCDYYRRMYDLYGPPKILDGVNVNMGIGEHQATNLMSDITKTKEYSYMLNKYDTSA